MSDFENSQYLRDRARDLRRLALEHVGQYAESLRKFAEELDVKAAQIAPQSQSDTFQRGG